MDKENNKKIEELDKRICVFLEDAGVPVDKITDLTERIKKIETQRNALGSFSEEEAKSISKRIELSLNQERVENRIIKAIEGIKLEPQITVEPPIIPDPKVILREPVPPKVEVRPPNVTVKPANVNFPKEMRVKGLGDFVKLIGKTFREKLDVGLERITRKNPLPVVLVFDERTYKAVGGKEGVVMGGGPSRLYLKNVDNETSQIVEEVGAPTIYNVAVTLNNTEYSQALPDKTRKVKIKMRGINADLKIAWASGESGTIYVNVPRGMVWVEDGLKLATPTSIYFQTAGTSTPYTVEIEVWTK